MKSPRRCRSETTSAVLALCGRAYRKVLITGASECQRASGARGVNSTIDGNNSIVSDIFRLLNTGSAPPRFGVLQSGLASTPYWILRR